MDSRLRSFEERDLRAVFDLARRAISRPEEQVGKPLWRSFEDAARDAERFERMGELAVVVEEEQEPVAFSGVEPDSFPNVFGPLVAPGARGRRLGSAVLDEAIARAGAAGLETLVAAVGRRNAGGKLLLARHGFRPRDRLIAIYRLFPDEHRAFAPALRGLELRRGGPADLDVVWELYREGFPVGRRTRELWQRWLERGEVYLTVEAGRVLAFVHLQPGWMTHIGVTEASRGRGLGELVASAALAEHWRVHEGDVVHLTVEAENNAAIRLYRRLGFAPWLLLETFARQP